mgnify:CR=1 FL=1
MSQINNYELMWILSSEESEESQEEVVSNIKNSISSSGGEISEFEKSVREGVSTKVGFEDGRKALILAEAAYLSLNESRLVKVSEITDKYNIEIS